MEDSVCRPEPTHGATPKSATEGLRKSERIALEHVEDGAISVVDRQWAVESPMWWNGFDGPDLDVVLGRGLIRIIPSRRSYQNVRITAAGKRHLAEAQQGRTGCPVGPGTNQEG